MGSRFSVCRCINVVQVVVALMKSSCAQTSCSSISVFALRAYVFWLCVFMHVEYKAIFLYILAHLVETMLSMSMQKYLLKPNLCYHSSNLLNLTLPNNNNIAILTYVNIV